MVLDLREVEEAADAPPSLPALRDVDVSALRAQLVRCRADAARLEARRELAGLRDRHWSAERVLEEGRLGIDWWEHPHADPHAVLGLVPGVSLDVATHARRRLARVVHPDAASAAAGDTLPQMAAVNVAYDRMRRALGPLPELGPDDGADTHQPAERPGGIALSRGGGG